MIGVGEVLLDDLCHRCDRNVSNRGLQLAASGLLLGLDGLACLGDDAIRLVLRTRGDLGALGLSLLLCLGDDRRCLFAGVDETVLVFLQDALALDAVLLGLLKGSPDRVLTLDQNLVEHRPTPFGENRQQDEEGDDHRDELVHGRQDCRNARGLLLSCKRTSRKRESHAASKCCYSTRTSR